MKTFGFVNDIIFMIVCRRFRFATFVDYIICTFVDGKLAHSSIFERSSAASVFLVMFVGVGTVVDVATVSS